MFAANGESDPTLSDMKYYRILQAWHEHDDHDFTITNSHDKASAVRDTSKKETLRRSLIQRLNHSKNALLIVGPTTRFDTDWVPFEIEYALDTCKIPIIVAYPGAGEYVLNVSTLRALWPQSLATRIDNETARTVHVPFKQKPIKRAISEWGVSNIPSWPITVIKRELYVDWGVLAA